MKNSKNDSTKKLFLKKETVTILNKKNQSKLVGGAGEDPLTGTTDKTVACRGTSRR